MQLWNVAPFAFAVHQIVRNPEPVSELGVSQLAQERHGRRGQTVHPRRPLRRGQALAQAHQVDRAPPGDGRIGFLSKEGEVLRAPPEQRLALEAALLQVVGRDGQRLPLARHGHARHTPPVAQSGIALGAQQGKHLVRPGLHRNSQHLQRQPV